MAITLSNGVTSYTLPDLLIEERHSPQRVLADVETSITGKMWRWERTVSHVPLTLVGGEDWGWIDVLTLTSLETWANAVNPSTPYVLSYESTAINVIWRHEDAPVIEADPIIERPNEATSDYRNNVSLKFLWVL